MQMLDHKSHIYINNLNNYIQEKSCFGFLKNREITDLLRRHFIVEIMNFIWIQSF